MTDIKTEIFTKLDNKIKFELIIIYPLLLLSVVIPFFTWNGVLQYDKDISLWFQRSGSLMVIFAVWVELRLFAIENLSNPISDNGTTFQDIAHKDALSKKYGKRIAVIKFFAAVLAVLGTLIWGYGDIIRNLY